MAGAEIFVNLHPLTVKGKFTWAYYNQYFEPQADKKDMLVRIIDNFPPGEYEVEAGFVLKMDMQEKYPSFFMQKFVFKK